MEIYSKLSESSRVFPVCYFLTDPLISDFTKPFNGQFELHFPNQVLRFTPKDINLRCKFNSFVIFLRQTIFSKGRTVISYDFKKFASFLRYKLKESYIPFEANIVDLKYGSFYKGLRGVTAPKTFQEASKIAATLASDVNWLNVHKQVFSPLAVKVLPSIETRGIVDESRVGVLYSSYEIEGQANGRLLTPKVSSNYLTVHSLSPDQKKVLRPRIMNENEKYYFVVFDYKQMEVSMIQWLAKDENLAEALLDPDGFYESIVPEGFEKNKKIGKAIFLPVLYGLQSFKLAERLKIPKPQADKLIEGLKYRFSDTFNWIEKKQSELEVNPIAKDCRGRVRDFTNESFYKRRNFEVQSPASLFCLHKLCELYNSLSESLMFHIHDGYVLTSDLKNCSKLIKVARGILESESKLFPGLKIPVTCQVGERLNNLRLIF